MLFIMDIVPMMKVLLKGPSKCQTCEQMGEIELIKAYQCFRLFFIPLFKWHVQYYLKHSCGAQVEITEEVAMHITSGQVDLSSMYFSHKATDQNTCRYCGKPLQEGFEYCPYCGNKH